MSLDLVRVKLDLSDVLYAVRSMASQEELGRTLFAITEAGHQRWAKLAQTNLHTTRQAYLLGLSAGPIAEGPLTYAIELKGELANKIERGASGYSLLEGILSGDNVRISKDGHRYTFVPMRMTLKGTQGRAGQPIDRVYAPRGPDSKATRTSLPPDDPRLAAAFTRIKKLRPGQSLPNLGLPLLKPELHAVDPFAGILKAGTKGHRYYVAFRTASDRVPSKWQHPGFTAHNFAEQAARHMLEVAPKALRGLMKTIKTATPPATGGP